MLFTPLPRDEVDANWPWLAHLLKPAVDRDPGNTLEDVHQSLVNGPDLVMVASGEAQGVVVFEVTADAECWVKYVAGSLIGGPKKRMGLMLDAMAWIERAAANAGCVGVNVCGRDWSVILSDYETASDWPNGLRKALITEKAA